MNFTLFFALAAFVAGLPLSTAYKSTNVQAYEQLKRSFLRRTNEGDRQRSLEGLAVADVALTITGVSPTSPSTSVGPPVGSGGFMARSHSQHLLSPANWSRGPLSKRLYSPRRRIGCRNDLARHRRHHVCPDVRQCGFPNNDLDVMFVLDRSGSVGPCDFQKELQFVESLACQLDGTLTRVGVVSFASRTRVDVPLCQHQNSCALVEQVRRVRYHGGSTATACALNMVNAIFDDTDQSFRRCFMNSATTPLQSTQGEELGSGSQVDEAASGTGRVAPRLDLPPSKRVFVITDGKSNTGGNPVESARKLRRRAAEVFALGVTRSVNRRELQAIASPDTCSPSCLADVMPNWVPGVSCPEECVEKHVFYLDDFNDFTELAQLFSNDPTSQIRCSQCARPATPVINGGWSEWSEWSKCPLPRMRRCGRVQRFYHYRSRHCDSPSRSVCGQPCRGNSIDRKLCFNEFVKCPEGPLCPWDKPPVKCDVDPCTTHKCEAFPAAKCTPNSCGKCSAVFKMDGMKVPCDKGKRLCDDINCGMGRMCVERTAGVPECCGYDILFQNQVSAGVVSGIFPKTPRKCIPAKRSGRGLPGRQPNLSTP